ncbi:molybdopterin-dependent oxidoreductase [Ornithinicoccus halotolerans]|uniref:molybdopterin-dependent oxidoreductase n=1 Tax=Ornithinicoccus halotolerans TaxID=1748220 RepID=UPI0012955071|nr:molybdopterin-dependent oxidoreductase [Ornithinicoccus halotolerans]
MASRAPAALAGIAAGAVTVGAAELAAVALARTVGTDGEPSPVLAVGAGFVDLTPPWLKDLAVSWFGTADKVALFVGMALTLTLVCAVLGEVTARHRRLGPLCFLLVGAAGAAAVLVRPDATPADVVPTAAATALGLVVLLGLCPRHRRGQPAAAGESVVGGAGAGSTPSRHDRRQVLEWGLGLTVVGVAALVAGRVWGQAGAAARRAREALRIPEPVRAVAVPAEASLQVPGVSGYLTPNDEFYRIDTALAVPQVDPGPWRLRVHGLVEQEVELSFDELLEQPLVEALVTLTCVSNQIGGSLVGNALWTGWPVRELLARARPLPEADMVLSTSADGWSAGTPLEVLADDRDALLAVAMNGEPLPDRHGFPVRMVVPGLYGYVSATKWVVDLEVTRFDQAQGYWTPRGWAERGPIKTASRIDVPREGDSVSPGEQGTVTVAGVAWAQTRGITAVEVRVDDGDWQQATLAAEPSVDSWRLWRWEWPAEPGEHTLTVRATDGTGRPQTEQVAPPAPDGASGWHSVRVSAAR